MLVIEDARGMNPVHLDECQEASSVPYRYRSAKNVFTQTYCTLYTQEVSGKRASLHIVDSSDKIRCLTTACRVKQAPIKGLGS